MSAVHAPGPWEMAGPVGKAVWIQSEARSNIAAVHGAYTDEGLANARLIAAAPTLLAALKSITPAFNTARIIMEDKEARDLAGEIVTEARAAIALAEGRS